MARMLMKKCFAVLGDEQALAESTCAAASPDLALASTGELE